MNDDVKTRAKTTKRRRRRPRTGAGTDDMSRLRRCWYRLFSLPPLRPPSTTLYPSLSPLSHLLLSMNFRPYQLILKAPFTHTFINLIFTLSIFNAVFSILAFFLIKLLLFVHLSREFSIFFIRSILLFYSIISASIILSSSAFVNFYYPLLSFFYTIDISNFYKSILFL